MGLHASITKYQLNDFMKSSSPMVSTKNNIPLVVSICVKKIDTSTFNLNFYAMNYGVTDFLKPEMNLGFSKFNCIAYWKQRA